MVNNLYKGSNQKPKKHSKVYTVSLVFALILWGFYSVDWTSDLIHTGGIHTARQVVYALGHPNFSLETLTRAIQASWITLSYAITGMSVSLFLAFTLGVLASGIFFEKNTKFLWIASGTRNFLTFLRSIHELVWAWLFVAALGLHPLSAILALGLPYGGTLGRIFADMLCDVPKAPLKALDSTGASQFQKLFYVYLPYALPNMVSYAMYRFECAVRASTIMSFVGLGGLGYEIQLSLNDLEYTDAFVYLYVLIGLILLIEIWSNQLRNSQTLSVSPHTHLIRKPSFKKLSLLGTGLALVMAWVYIHLTEGIFLGDIFNAKNLNYTKKFIKGLLGFGESLPAFFQWQAWEKALTLSLETLQMSILSIFLAGVFALLLAVPGAKARTVHGSSLFMTIKKTIFYVLRALFILSRAIPELVWAMLLVFLLKPGPLPGVLALAIHNFGILGKLCAEVVENMDQGPLEALKSSGATSMQTLLYGVLPLTIPKFITYLLYRWEVIIRTSIIVGFVGAGGLGQAFKLSMSWFKYSEITLYLICYLILIGGVDYFAQCLRRSLKLD